MRKNIISILVIVILMVISWYKILSLTFTGEGYYYFFFGLKENPNFFRYDIGASLLFDLLEPIFRDNFFPFQLLLLFSFVVIVTLFYFVVYKMTERKMIALFSAILFGLNYNTVFEMIGTGAYQNFVQRVLFLLILFSSFILFLKFLKNQKIFFYLLSLILAIVGVGLAHFNFFYVLFLMAFILGFLLTKKMSYRKILFISFCSLIYFITSFLIVNIPVIFKMNNLVPSEGFFSYFFNNIAQITVQFFRQLTILSIPEVIFRQLFSIFNISYIEFIYRSQGIQYLYLPIFLLYLLTGIFLYKKEKKLRPAIFASLLFLPLIHVFNMYMRGDKIVFLEPGNRYLFVPGMAYSVFWAIFLTVFSEISSKTKMIGYSILTFWIIMQIFAINNQFQKELSTHVTTKKIISYFKNDLSSKLKDDSIVVTPYIMGNWGSWYINMFYGRKDTVFIPRMTPEIEWREELKRGTLKRSFDPKKDFIIYYDENSQTVIDITKDYKSIIKI